MMEKQENITRGYLGKENFEKAYNKFKGEINLPESYILFEDKKGVNGHVDTITYKNISEELRERFSAYLNELRLISE